jgi:CDP-glycerol glycerophosphotransferase (TagB/SpsB family)
MKQFKLLPTLIAKWLVRTPYWMISLLVPVNRNKVTFASYRSDGLSGNLAAVFDRLQQEKPELTYTLLFRRYQSSRLGRFGFALFMFRAAFHLATSRYVLIDDYFFPAYVIKPRKGSEIIQLWHAAGAFKKFGHSTRDKTYGPSEEYLSHVHVHGNYAKAIVSSSVVIPAFAEAFDMDPKDILPLGLPRTDVFFQESVIEDACARFDAAYPQTIGKKRILYAPTFRGKSHGQTHFECPIDLAQLRAAVGDEWVFLVHLHPYLKDAEFVTNVPTHEDFVIRIEHDFNIQELMMVADVLVTDYSSVIFDFSLLQKPMAFFATDLDDYLAERDFYYNYIDMIPGPFFEKTDGLAEWLASGTFDMDRIRTFRDRFFDDVDGQATNRVIDYLWPEHYTSTDDSNDERRVTGTAT